MKPALLRRFVFSACLVVLPLQAALAAQPPAPAAVTTELRQPFLLGQGTHRWFGLKIFDATLWSTTQEWQGLTQRFALELRYARHLSGKKIAEVSIEEMQKLEKLKPEQQQRWLQQMQAMFPDVEENTRITGVHLPGEGARFFLNDQPLGEIRDPEFARLFFGIWLDNRSSVPALRAQLTGKPR